MKKLTSLALLTLFAFQFAGAPLWPDYTSLTPTEREIVRRALEQAKFYKYYADLVAGKDTIDITAVRFISDSRIDEKTTDAQYEIDVSLKVNDQIFKRTISATVRIEVHGKFWTFGKIMLTAGGYVLSVVLLFVIIL